jgi:hypothetical protein
MTLRPALLAAAALAAAFCAFLALNRWGPGGNGGLLVIVTEAKRGEELEPHIEVARRRADAKRALAAEVVAGRMTLREAAGHFRRLDEADPGIFVDVLAPPRDERFFCESVLSVAWVVLMDQERYAAAARWYAEAFATHPHLLAGRPTGQRYLAARAAYRAGCGQGRDAADLDETSRAGLRRQALDWLRAELEAQRLLLEEEPQMARFTVARDLQYWLEAPDEVGVRGPEALGLLPAAERHAWQKFWADVAGTRARAQGTTVREQEAGSQVQRPER